jgi:hypothetical protein
LRIDLSDFIDAKIAVVDAIGTIVRCNRKWEKTASWSAPLAVDILRVWN